MLFNIFIDDFWSRLEKANTYPTVIMETSSEVTVYEQSGSGSNSKNRITKEQLVVQKISVKSGA